jgi:hypothetical protein
VKTDALTTLDRLVTSGKSREQRLTTLIRSPDEADIHWFMHVPTCFNDALDIRRTNRIFEPDNKNIWTQGSNFSFGPGDTIYDTPRAYERWADALQHIRFCFKVSIAIAVTAAKRISETHTSPRVPGHVTFTITMS